MVYNSLRKIRLEKSLYTQREAACILGVSAGWLQDISGILPPSYKLGERRVYTEDDLEAVRQYIRAQIPCSQKREDRLHAKGLYSMSEAARQINVPRITLVRGISEDRYPGPTHRFGCQKYYKKEDIEELRLIFAAKKRPANSIPLHQVAKKLGCSVASVHNYIRRWPDLGTAVGPKKRYLTPDNIQELKKRIEEYHRPAGCVCLIEAYKILGLTKGRGVYRWGKIKDRENLGKCIDGKRWFDARELNELRAAMGFKPVVPHG